MFFSLDFTTKVKSKFLTKSFNYGKEGKQNKVFSFMHLLNNIFKGFSRLMEFSENFRHQKTI